MCTRNQLLTYFLVSNRTILEWYSCYSFHKELPTQKFHLNLLSFGAEAKKSQLLSILWHQNAAGHFDQRDDANVGYTKRKAWQLHENVRTPASGSHFSKPILAQWNGSVTLTDQILKHFLSTWQSESNKRTKFC